MKSVKVEEERMNFKLQEAENELIQKEEELEKLKQEMREYKKETVENLSLLVEECSQIEQNNMRLEKQLEEAKIREDEDKKLIQKLLEELQKYKQE